MGSPTGRLEKVPTAYDPGSTQDVSTDEVIFEGRGSRVESYITNTHATSILWLKLGDTAVIGEGIPVYPNGTWRNDHYTGEVRGVASTGTITIAKADL